MPTRRDLRRRRPIVLEFEERYDAEADQFGVIAYVGRVVDGETRVDHYGGYVNHWSALSAEVQDAVRADLRSIAEREALAGNRPR